MASPWPAADGAAIRDQRDWREAPDSRRSRVAGAIRLRDRTRRRTTARTRSAGRSPRTARSARACAAPGTVRVPAEADVRPQHQRCARRLAAASRQSRARARAGSCGRSTGDRDAATSGAVVGRAATTNATLASSPAAACQTRSRCGVRSNTCQSRQARPFGFDRARHDRLAGAIARGPVAGERGRLRRRLRQQEQRSSRRARACAARSLRPIQKIARARQHRARGARDPPSRPAGRLTTRVDQRPAGPQPRARQQVEQQWLDRAEPRAEGEPGVRDRARTTRTTAAVSSAQTTVPTIVCSADLVNAEVAIPAERHQHRVDVRATARRARRRRSIRGPASPVGSRGPSSPTSDAAERRRARQDPWRRQPRPSYSSRCASQ